MAESGNRMPLELDTHPCDESSRSLLGMKTPIPDEIDCDVRRHVVDEAAEVSASSACITKTGKIISVFVGNRSFGVGSCEQIRAAPAGFEPATPKLTALRSNH